MKTRSKNAVPVLMFIVAVFVTAYLAGVLTAHYKVFPYPHVRNAARTLRTLVHLWRGDEEEYFGEYIEPTDIPAGDAPANRWTVLDTSVPRLPTIAFGGTNQYLELCPERGCIAVSFDAVGKATGSWPFRPTDIHAADITGDEYPHEMLGFDPLVNLSPIGVLRYDDGDVLVNFQARGDIFPFGAGIARVAPDGKPRWTRFDYSHHWSSFRADQVAYVPSLRVAEASLKFTLGNPPSPLSVTLNCSGNRPQFDIIQLVDPSGGVVGEVELVRAFVESNWAGLLPETTDKCDPLHLNFIDEIDADAGPGLAPGDLVISLRNISKFAILDRSTHAIKRVVSGGFVQQHAVQHLSGSKFLVFDNHGGDREGPSSRIVELDLATGVERRVFPNGDTPAQFARVFSDTAGHIDISPDKTRILASFTHAGRGFEIEVATGRLLAVYDNLHDLSSRPGVADDQRKFAGRFALYGMSYIRK